MYQHHDSPSYHFLKKLIQLSISFSLLSILFWHPYWLPFFRSFISNISTCSSHLFSLATDKNYIFLLCNGILVFIAKYSSRSADTCPPHLPETNSDNELVSKSYRQSMQLSLVEKPVDVEGFEIESQMNAVMPEDDAEGKSEVYQIIDGTVTEREVTSEEDDEEFLKKEFDGLSYDEQVQEENQDERVEEEEEEEEEAIAEMSTEELNRKFDEFIRRMKEELRIEAQQQLIVV